MLPLLMLGQNYAERRDNINYLGVTTACSCYLCCGVTFLSCKHVSTDCNILKRKFYADCKCIFSECYNVNAVI